jgi:hypothetical protein
MYKSLFLSYQSYTVFMNSNLVARSRDEASGGILMCAFVDVSPWLIEGCKSWSLPIASSLTHKSMSKLLEQGESRLLCSRKYYIYIYTYTIYHLWWWTNESLPKPVNWPPIKSTTRVLSCAHPRDRITCAACVQLNPAWDGVVWALTTKPIGSISTNRADAPRSSHRPCTRLKPSRFSHFVIFVTVNSVILWSCQ